ncbi:MAG: tRNA pseudouridine(54/55) synthase Pus10 [Candidatus Jordarchaeum sp.]|uniref:tRNA pseudouridine(54/55) synthase Pus10 n=1 Tax=Candidatus Jordarchaeum sp. TaxID=2823881 RepID=UPI00404AD68D
MEIIDQVINILKEHKLCDNCLGRQFALLGTKATNAERGYSIKMVLTLIGHKYFTIDQEMGENLLKIVAINGFFTPALETLRKKGLELNIESKCEVCENIFSKKEEIARKIAIELENYNFNNFLIGSKIPPRISEKEDMLRSTFEINTSEALKAEINREIGKVLTMITGKNVEFNRPDILIVLDIEDLSLSIEVNPLHISGRYLKLVRGIPQTRWPCRECGGEGCERCNGTGKMYQESVEEIIAKPVLEITEGEETKFHGAGREDIDARMLGNGRQFVLEIKNPKKRDLDLKELENIINDRSEGKIRVMNLNFSNKEEVRRIKALAQTSSKTYSALVELKDQVPPENLELLKTKLSGEIIRQQTPIRVSHRRANLVRTKKVFKVDYKILNSNKMELIIECQGGLYIKEFISGDEGRTEPSISSILNTEAKCLELDVIKVNQI